MAELLVGLVRAAEKHTTCDLKGRVRGVLKLEKGVHSVRRDEAWRTSAPERTP